MGLAANGLLFRATPEASLGGGILATQASACLSVDILILLGPFLCAVCVITLSYVSLQCWLLDEWVSSTPQPPTPSPFGELYYYSLALTGKSEKHQHSAKMG